MIIRERGALEGGEKNGGMLFCVETLRRWDALALWLCLWVHPENGVMELFVFLMSLDTYPTPCVTRNVGWANFSLQGWWQGFGIASGGSLGFCPAALVLASVCRLSVRLPVKGFWSVWTTEKSWLAKNSLLNLQVSEIRRTFAPAFRMKGV